MAGEGYARIRMPVGGPETSHVQLANGVFSESWRFVYHATHQLVGSGTGAGGGIRFYLHVGLAEMAGMFFEGLSAATVSDIVCGTLAPGQFSVTYTRSGAPCGGTGEEGCYCLKIAPNAGFNVNPGDTIGFTYTGRSPKISTRFGLGRKHFFHLRSRLHAADPSLETADWNWRHDVPEESLPSFTVEGRQLAKLFVSMPSDVRWLGSESEPFEVAVVALDDMGQPAHGFTGTVNLTGNVAMTGLPASHAFTPQDDAIKVFEGVRLAVWPEDRACWVEASWSTVTSMGKPARVHTNPPPYLRLWGDVHCHTRDSDDHCGRYVRFEQVHGFMRHAARLDFGAVTDHDTSNMTGETWSGFGWSGQKERLAAMSDGRYLGLLGYEFSESVDGRAEHYVALQWVEPTALLLDRNAYEVEELGPRMGKLGPVLIQPHIHSSANTTWQDYTDNGFRRLVEWFSNKNPTRNATYFEGDGPSPGAFTIRNAWANGHLLGVYGGSDSHDGCSGTRNFSGLDAEQSGQIGGLTCVLADGFTRRDVWNALVHRRCYATTGARLWLDFTVNGAPMGSVLPLWDVPAGNLEISVDVVGDNTLDYVKLFKYQAGGSWQELALPGGGPGIGSRYFQATLSTEPRPDSYTLYYVRVKQVSEGTVTHFACSSPVFLVDR